MGMGVCVGGGGGGLRFVIVALPGLFSYLVLLRSGFITKTRLFKCIKQITPKTENSQVKTPDIFHISVQNIDCGYSLERVPQSMFLYQNKKKKIIMFTPVNFSFTI